MLLELVKRLRDIDSNLSLAINLSEDGVYTFSIDSMNVGSYLYSYSSTDCIDCYNKILYFINALTDNEKFEKLFDDILSTPLEV